MPYAVNIEGIGEINVDDDATDLDILQNALIAKMQAGQVSDHDAQLSYLEGLVEQGYSQQPQEQPTEPVETGPDRGYFMEAMAGIGSGALHTLGAGLSGLERLAERADIDPTGEDPGWLRQAGEALKSGGEQIKASPDLPDWYFNLFSAFGSVLGFTAPAVIAAPLGGLPSLAISGALGIGAGADEAFTRAKAAGATEEQIDQSTFMGGGIGFTEIAAPMKMLQRVAKVFPNVFRGTWQGKGLGKTSAEEIRKKTTNAAQNDRLAKMVGVDPRPFRAFGKRLASSAGLEASQEAVAAIAQNAISRYMYAPDTDLVDMQVMEEGLYGGSAGAMMEGVISAFSARKSKRVRQRFDKFTESDTYKEIKKAADEAGEVYDKAEEGSTEKQTAAEKIVRADAMMEGALLEEVWGSQDAVDYLKAQKGPNGERLYSDRFFADMDKIRDDQIELAEGYRKEGKLDEADILEGAARLEHSQRLKELYIQHTNSPNTKYEAEAEEILYETVNPATRFNYTFDEIAEIKKRKKGIALEGEVKARVEDFNRNDPWQVQQTKIDLRMNHRASRNRLNEIQEEHGNQALDDLAVIMNAAPNLRPTKATVTGATGAGSQGAATLADLTNENNWEPGSYADSIGGIADNIREDMQVAEDLEAQPEEEIETGPPPGSPADEEGAIEDIEESEEDVVDDNEGKEGDAVVPPAGTGTPIEGAEEETGEAEGIVEDEEIVEGDDDVTTGEAEDGEIAEGGTEPETVPGAFNQEHIAGIERDLIRAVEILLDSQAYAAEFRAMYPVKSGQEFIDDVKANPTGWQDTPKYNWKQVASSEPRYMAMRTIVPLLETAVDNAALRTREQLAGQYPDLNWNNPKQALFDGWINNPKAKADMAMKSHTMFVEESSEDVPYKVNESGTKSTKATWGKAEFEKMSRAIMTMVGLVNPEKAKFEMGDDGYGNPSFVWEQEDGTLRNVIFMVKPTAQYSSWGRFPLGSFRPTISQQTLERRAPSAFAGNKFHHRPGTIMINVHAIGGADKATLKRWKGMGYGRTRWEQFLQTGSHEAFHAARELVLSQEQINLWNSLITEEVAIANGWGSVRESYESTFNEVFKIWKNANPNATQEKINEIEKHLYDDWMTNEAQAFVYGKWYGGAQIVGVSPAARRLMDMIREFMHKFGNFMKGSGYIVTDKEMSKFNEEQMIAQKRTELMRSFANGTLAQNVGRLPAENAASLAREYVPPTHFKTLEKEAMQALEKITGVVSGIGGFDIPGMPGSGMSSGEVMAKDISNFARIFSHLHAVAQKSPLFKNVYNKIRQRVDVRNTIKMAADIFAEHVGRIGGLFKLNQAGTKQVENLTTVADEAGVEPTFENVGTENATATIKFNQPLYDQMMERYVTEERFFRMTGINPEDLVVADEVYDKEVALKDAEGNPLLDDEGEQIIGVDPNPQPVWTMEVTDSQIANSFAGSYKGLQRVGNETYSAILYNFLNTGDLKGKGLGRRIRVGGPEEVLATSEEEANRRFLNTDEDINALIDEAKTVEFDMTVDGVTRTVKGFVKANGQFMSERYAAYKKQALAEGVSKHDILFGELDSVTTGKEMSQVQEVYTLLNLIANERREGYFPHYRFGDHVAVVYNENNEPVFVQPIEATFTQAMSTTPFIGDVLQKRLEAKQRELVSKLEEDFGDEYTVEPVVFTIDTLIKEGRTNLLANISVLDSLAAIYTGTASDKKLTEHQDPQSELKDKRNRLVRETLMGKIRSGITMSRAQSLLKRRKDLPGYINETNNNGRYFKQSFQRFIDSGSNIASSLLVEPDLLEAMHTLTNQVNRGINSNLHKLAQATFQYINDPNNEANMLRSFAFHSFLGFNISSAVVNATQTPQVTYPIISSIIGPVKGASTVFRAGKDALKLWTHMQKDVPRLGKYGFELFTTEQYSEDYTDAQGEPAVRENTRVIVDMQRKPDWMDDNEFRALAERFRNGAIQPIQNMDLGAGEIAKHLNSNVGRFFADASGHAFGLVENVNRITAFLSFYRAAKDAQEEGGKNLQRMKAYARSTRFSNSADLVDFEAFAGMMGEMGIEKTQFYMGKENRPTLFRGKPMSVVSQFMSFPFHVLGLYADSLNRSLGAGLGQFSPDDQALLKSIARQQLALMALTTMAFGGAMGLPFMENFKQLIRMITEHFGDEVGEDIEQGMREIMGPTFGYNATDMFLRGLPRWLDIDVSRRTGYGDILPLRMLMGGDPTDFAGPAVSRWVDMVRGVNTAFEQGRNVTETAFNVAASITPVAIGNMYRALYTEPRLGTFTQRGQQLLPAGSLSGFQQGISALGFTTKDVSQARERRGIENYYQYRSRNGKEMYTQRMTTSLSGYMRSLETGNIDRAMDHISNYYSDYLHVMQHDLDNMSDPSRQYRINVDTVFDRAMRSLSAMGMDTGPRVSKDVRSVIQKGIMEGSIPYKERG